jgi:DNA repair protein RecO (recombination protein O)
MSAEKTESIILSVAPYRETSCILRLFTRSRGLVHGIAKGARRSSGKSTPTPLDRGLLLEALLYHRPNRELHTLGGLHVANFFHGIRADITKSALRDITIELYLKTITEPSPHPELFDLLVGFLAGLDGERNPSAAFLMLWRFIGSYCEHTGFGINTENYAGNGIDSRVVKIISVEDAERPHYSYSMGECVNVTEQLLRYCRLHFDIRAPFNSMEFVRCL